MKTIIRNATIVNEGRKFIGSVVIEDEMIQQVLEGDDSTQSYDMEIDATGLYLFPGVIDDHVHFREPGLTHKADIASESRTAAARLARREISNSSKEQSCQLLFLFWRNKRQCRNPATAQQSTSTRCQGLHG